MKRVLLGLAYLGLGLSAGSAQALDLDPMIDFRDAAFQGANYQSSFSTTVGGVGITLSAFIDGKSWVRPKLYWDDIDGIGVRYNYEDDEIEGNERLKVSFSAPLMLTELAVSDLFAESTYNEIGRYQLDAGDAVTFDAGSLGGTAGNKANGEAAIGLPSVQASSIVLSAPGKIGSQSHEFSLAGLSYQQSGPGGGAGSVGQIPEPRPILLFGAGLVVLGAIRRRTGRSAF